MATYAVGDLQGCCDPLRRLLDYLQFDPADDRLWLVGDLVNRGPESLKTLRFVRSLGNAVRLVLGNHDLHLIMQAEGYGKANREDTLAGILAAPDRDELLVWLRQQPLVYGEGHWTMVHAGLLPQWSVAQAKRLSAEVSNALNAGNYREFLANMWGSEPTVWRDDLAGWDRLRVIVNAMTRMRYVTAEGVMELRALGNKAPPECGPLGCRPWFEARNDNNSPDNAKNLLICGHWSGLGLRMEKNLLALDTGCLWGGALTAVRLDDRRVFQMPCRQYVKPAGWE